MAGGWWDGLVPDYGDVRDPEVRARYGYLEGWVSIAGNVALFAVKLALGLFIASIALVADGVHSLSDVATSVVVILGFRMARKPPDADHPYGHGRVEYIATLVIAVLLGITGLEFIMTAAGDLGDPQPLENGDYAVAVAVVVLLTAVVKEALAQFCSAISRRIGSDALEADAWHHRSDALSSVGVAMAILGSYYGLTVLDPVFGVVVAVIIIYVGVRLVRTASDQLMGPAPDEALVQEIRAKALGVKDVEGVHDIAVHDYGVQKVITLHAEVREDLVLDEAHEIADRLDARLREVTSFPTIVHLDPAGTSPWGQEMERMLALTLERESRVVSYHRVQVIRRSGTDQVSMHLIVDGEMSVADSHQLSHRLERALEEACGEECNVIVHFEPCVDDCEECRINCDKRKGAPPGNV
jgi:cation diffusion facilitator family transporter